MYQALKTVFDHNSKYIEVPQKYSAAQCVFKSPLSVWKCGQTRSFVFDTLREFTSRIFHSHFSEN